MLFGHVIYVLQESRVGIKHGPVSTGDLTNPKQNYNAPNWNVKHYKSVEFRKLLESQAPPQTQSPPIENFLAAVPIKPFVNSIA